MAQISPYLIFNGNCREAMNFYKSALGGVLSLQTVSESPQMAAQMPLEMKDSVLHSTLINGTITLMASDLNRQNPVEGNTVQLCINCQNENELYNFFSGLSQDGKVIETIKNMPWGAKYGELVDKYGKHWIFNCPIK
jgi:PhnB protein